MMKFTVIFFFLFSLGFMSCSKEEEKVCEVEVLKVRYDPDMDYNSDVSHGDVVDTVSDTWKSDDPDKFKETENNAEINAENYENGEGQIGELNKSDSVNCYGGPMGPDHDDEVWFRCKDKVEAYEGMLPRKQSVIEADCN